MNDERITTTPASNNRVTRVEVDGEFAGQVVEITGRRFSACRQFGTTEDFRRTSEFRSHAAAVRFAAAGRLERTVAEMHADAAELVRR